MHHAVPSWLGGLVDGARRGEELLAERRCPGTGAIAEALDLPAIVGLEAVVSSTERPEIVGRGRTAGFPTFGMVKI